MQKLTIVLLVLCLALAGFICSRIESAQRLRTETIEAFRQRDRALAQLAIAIESLQEAETNKAKGSK